MLITEVNIFGETQCGSVFICVNYVLKYKSAKQLKMMRIHPVPSL